MWPAPPLQTAGLCAQSRVQHCDPLSPAHWDEDPVGIYCSDPWLVCSSLGSLSLQKDVCTSIGPAWSDSGLLPSLLPGPGSSHLGPQWVPQGLDKARLPAACSPSGAWGPASCAAYWQKKHMLQLGCLSWPQAPNGWFCQTLVQVDPACPPRNTPSSWPLDEAPPPPALAPFNSRSSCPRTAPTWDSTVLRQVCGPKDSLG